MEDVVNCNTNKDCEKEKVIESKISLVANEISKTKRMINRLDGIKDRLKGTDPIGDKDQKSTEPTNILSKLDLLYDGSKTNNDELSYLLEQLEELI